MFRITDKKTKQIKMINILIIEYDKIFKIVTHNDVNNNKTDILPSIIDIELFSSVNWKLTIIFILYIYQTYN